MRRMIPRAGRIARLHPIVQVSRSVVESVSAVDDRSVVESVEDRRNRVESVSAEVHHSVVESVEDRRNRVESVEVHHSVVESVEDRHNRVASVAASVRVLCHRSLRHLIATRTG